MKNVCFFIVLVIVITFTTAAHSASFSTFSGGKTYSGQGRWIKNGETFLFRINEGNANEENIVFTKNHLQLAHQVKYKICFKVNKDCHLDCKGELVKNLTLLQPWEDAESWIPSPEGAYPTASESACK